ncbi:cysteine desulfurase family protein [Nocardia implantans]|uniref:Cysteine desulfurase family protein n=1 Tax=Nocardia implantans TaxID=3108168 RepID=A0ABU6ATJ4_9NOCA|nr:MULTISPECIES: cysteine desulfurase family protein [unclassified Nocardia]MBF6190980.1 cysteine desulfurase [Nocardia beijingensis]MEA3528972.1 cysteine desulfurase family protein [Nocardia sp. CDC192]MEB3510637.1 cysteine desulfurase family protein [Nocardia sp. CDC186]
MKSAFSGPVNGAAPQTVYLDHAATTPMLPAAIEAMTAALRSTGNASSLHGSGRAARRLLEEARESIAADLGARPSEVIFTSGGTESDNLAVKGIFWARRDADPRRSRIIASSVEHHAVIDAVEWLERHEGAQVTWLPVDADGVVAPAALRAALSAHPDDVALVTVMWANNEVGTIQPIGELASVAAEFGVPMHSDAVQAAAQLPIDFGASGLSAASFAGHKVGGPHGIGVLLLGRQVPCVPLLHGGGHERDLRSGTSDTAAAIGLAAALRQTSIERHARTAELVALRDALIDGIRATAPDALLNGPVGDGRLPGNVHVTFPGCEGDSLLMLLDAAGIECSTGSACTAGVATPSHVLIAMGVEPWQARGSLRFSLGHTSTRADVDAVLAVLPQVVERAKAAGLAGAKGGV